MAGNLNPICIKSYLSRGMGIVNGMYVHHLI